MPDIRVRMYRVGFGDCFLVTLTDDNGQPHHVLIDCGVHFKGNADTMDQVVADIAEVTSGNLALVVATHSHQDHISGFGSHADTFKEMTAREVWMPWVEDPSDAQAKSYREMQMAMLMHLEGPAAFWVESQNVRDQAALAACAVMPRHWIPCGEGSRAPRSATLRPWTCFWRMPLAFPD